MPHIVLEYSDSLNFDVPVVLTQLRDALVQTSKGDVDVMRVKTRALPFEHFVVKDAPYREGCMAHVTLSLLVGRSVETRAAYGQALYDVMKAHFTQDGCALTLEVREMPREMYFM